MKHQTVLEVGSFSLVESCLIWFRRFVDMHLVSLFCVRGFWIQDFQCWECPQRWQKELPTQQKKGREIALWQGWWEQSTKNESKHIAKQSKIQQVTCALKWFLIKNLEASDLCRQSTWGPRFLHKRKLQVKKHDKPWWYWSTTAHY